MEMIYFCRLHGIHDKAQALGTRNLGLGSATYQLWLLGQDNPAEPRFCIWKRGIISLSCSCKD